MNRREFIHSSLMVSAGATLPACSPLKMKKPESVKVMTVNGPLNAGELGFTLTHEHLFADVRPYNEQVKNPIATDIDEVIEVVLPYLQEIRARGCRTLIDCTATHLGRNPLLIKRLSEASGLHMLTVTGNYLAADGVFVPPYVINDSTDQLARRWIGEWKDGIGETGIRPGLIKLGMNGGPLSLVEKKALQAAATTHLVTGLTIGTHIGPWRDVDPGFNATSAFEQIALLEKIGISPSAWIWIHAQNEKDLGQHTLAARRNAWISFDGFRPDQTDNYIAMIDRMRSAKLLHRVLVSQDAGWYTAGEPRGGDFAPFHPIFTSLIPALKENGFTEDDIHTVFVSNPARAFSFGVRLLS